MRLAFVTLAGIKPTLTHAFMYRIAIKILLGDRAKYLGLVFGVAFATLLMTQQVSIFIGIMARTASPIFNVTESDVWVMDTRVQYLDEVEPMRDIELSNVRSVPGVKWAVPFYKGISTMSLPSGKTQQVQLIGVDDTTLVGLGVCEKMVEGDRLSLKRPQTAIMDLNGFIFTWPTETPHIGKKLEMNDHRITITGLCDVSPTFMTWPIMYVSYETAMEITPPQRNKMSFVLAKAADGVSPQELAKRIQAQTGLQALTNHDFAWRSIDYMLTRTGIPINFGITIALGVIIGAAITAQTFYIFVIENLRQFASMKAIGVTNSQLMRMVLLMAAMVGSMGYSLGVGATALFFKSTEDVTTLKGVTLYWQAAAGSAAVITVIILFSILFSLRRVFTLDPAIVFRG